MVLSFLLLLAIPFAFAASYRQSTTWTMDDITTNSTNCTSINKIGDGYSKSLGVLSFTNSSTVGAGLAAGAGDNQYLAVLLRYGDTSAVASNTSFVNATSIDATSYSAKYVGVCFKTDGVNGTGVYDIDSLALSYAGGGAIDDDTIEGLPMIGSDTGNFLKNLAPGVGAFIIIIGIFAAVAGIIYAIVGIVKRKVEV